jgi:hypothetical protein
MKYWEIIADNLTKAGWSLGCVAVGCSARILVMSPGRVYAMASALIARHDE